MLSMAEEAPVSSSTLPKDLRMDTTVANPHLKAGEIANLSSSIVMYLFLFSFCFVL